MIYQDYCGYKVILVITVELGIFANAPRIAIEPNSTADTDDNPPLKLPIGVRA